MRGLEGLARWLRDSNGVLALVVVLSGIALLPLVSMFIGAAVVAPGEFGRTLSWWVSAVLVTLYSLVHVAAAVADTRQFLEEYGTEYAGGGTVFCHALGQRLFVLLGAGFTLVFLAITGPGAGVPFVILLVVGLLAAVLIGPSTGIPMNRWVTTRLEEYRG